MDIAPPAYNALTSRALYALLGRISILTKASSLHMHIHILPLIYMRILFSILLIFATQSLTVAAVSSDISRSQNNSHPPSELFSEFSLYKTITSINSSIHNDEPELPSRGWIDEVDSLCYYIPTLYSSYIVDRLSSSVCAKSTLQDVNHIINTVNKMIDDRNYLDAYEFINSEIIISNGHADWRYYSLRLAISRKMGWANAARYDAQVAAARSPSKAQSEHFISRYSFEDSLIQSGDDVGIFRSDAVSYWFRRVMSQSTTLRGYQIGKDLLINVDSTAQSRFEYIQNAVFVALQEEPSEAPRLFPTYYAHKFAVITRDPYPSKILLTDDEIISYLEYFKSSFSINGNNRWVADAICDIYGARPFGDLSDIKTACANARHQYTTSSGFIGDALALYRRGYFREALNILNRENLDSVKNELFSWSGRNIYYVNMGHFLRASILDRLGDNTEAARELKRACSSCSGYEWIQPSAALAHPWNVYDYHAAVQRGWWRETIRRSAIGAPFVVLLAFAGWSIWRWGTKRHMARLEAEREHRRVKKERQIEEWRTTKERLQQEAEKRRLDEQKREEEEQLQRAQEASAQRSEEVRRQEEENRRRRREARQQKEQEEQALAERLARLGKGVPVQSMPSSPTKIVEVFDGAIAQRAIEEERRRLEREREEWEAQKARAATVDAIRHTEPVHTPVQIVHVQYRLGDKIRIAASIFTAIIGLFGLIVSVYIWYTDMYWNLSVSFLKHFLSWW